VLYKRGPWPFEHELMTRVQMAILYLHTSINYLLLKVDSKSLVDHILDGDKSTDACGDNACGDGACGDGACGDGACGDGACGDGACGDGACGDGACGDGVCGDNGCGDNVDLDNGENDEGRINVEEREVFAMVVVFFTFFM